MIVSIFKEGSSSVNLFFVYSFTLPLALRQSLPQGLERFLFFLPVTQQLSFNCTFFFLLQNTLHLCQCFAHLFLLCFYNKIRLFILTNGYSDILPTF